MEEGRRGNKTYYDQDDEDLQMRIEFRKPRDSLLNVVAEYYATCQPRLRELRKMVSDPSFRPPELLDHKSHNVSMLYKNTNNKPTHLLRLASILNFCI